MRYHETVPSESGFYIDVRSPGTLQMLGFFGGSYTNECSETVNPLYPLIGWLPTNKDEAIALACEVAFARMEVSRHSLPVSLRNMDDALVRSYVVARERFLGNERSLSLLRDMERVTRELGGET